MGSPPRDCTSWNDGCNTCMVRNGVVAGCTEMACFEKGEPFCMAFTDGRTCRSASDCSAVAATSVASSQGGWGLGLFGSTSCDIGSLATVCAGVEPSVTSFCTSDCFQLVVDTLGACTSAGASEEQEQL